jgi:hypothetical protein
MDADAVLRPGDGPRRHWIGRPRGFAKTSDLGAFTLAALLSGIVTPEHPGYAGAGDRQQASLLLDSLALYARRTPGVAEALEIQTWRAVVRSTGATLDVLAADSSGSYGLRPSWCVLDELCAWPDVKSAKTFYEAIATSWPKVAGSTAVIITTAGSPGHWSHAVYENAEREASIWRVSETHVPAPWIDQAMIEAERRSLTESAFSRLWENRWATGDDALVSAADLEAAAVLDGPLEPEPGCTYVLALDIGLVSDRTVVVVAHAERAEDGPAYVVVDRLWRWQGTKARPVDLGAVEATLVEAYRAYPGTVICDPYQAAQMTQRLKTRGVPVRTFDFTTRSVGRLASTMLQLLRAHRLHLPRDPELLAELAEVRIIENAAGVPRLDHLAGHHDDQVVAIALAAQRLVERPAMSWGRLYGAATCVCGAVYAETNHCCPECGTDTPERPETISAGWGSVYRSMIGCGVTSSPTTRMHLPLELRPAPGDRSSVAPIDRERGPVPARAGSWFA